MTDRNNLSSEKDEVTALHRRIAHLEKLLAQARSAETELQERYEALLNAIPHSLVVFDRNWTCRLANQAALRTLRLPTEKLLGSRLTGLLPQIEEPAIFETCRQVMETHRPGTATTHYADQAGQDHWYEVHIYPVPEGLLCLATDITAHKQTEESLRQSEQKFRSLVEQSVDGIVLVDDRGRIVEWNQGQEQITGLKRADVLGSFLWDVQYRLALEEYKSPTHYERLKAMTLDFLQSGQADWLNRPVELDFRHCAGQRRTLHTLTFSVKLKDGFMIGSINRDITGRKQAEEALRRRNRELNLLNQMMAISGGGLTSEEILDVACRELIRTFDLTRASAALFNASKTTITVVAEYLTEGQPGMGETTAVVKQPYLQDLLKQKVPLIIADNSTTDRQPVRVALGQNQAATLLVFPLIVANKVAGILRLESARNHTFNSRDIDLAWSVAGEAANALARSHLMQTHRRLGAAIEQTEDSVIITDAEGIIIYVNPAGERISGYSEAELIGQPVSLLLSPHSNPDLPPELWSTQAWRGRFVSRRKNGELFTTEATVTPIRDEHGTITAYVSVQRDITPELELEAHMYQAQKMETVGQLAGGIAHDFNNILTAIIGHAGMALATLPPEHPARPDIEGIEVSAQRAAYLTRQLLVFARRQIGQPQPVNLDDLIEAMRPMLRRLTGEEIEMIISPGSNPGQIRIDPHQFEQILLNLVVNARDAMPDGGRLIIETACITLANQIGIGRPAELGPGDYVVLAVSDTGTGISPEIRDRIFDPFFTTKEVGQGTGLGLATCFGIVQQYEGYIGCESKPGQGTTFRVYLPRLHTAVKEE